jgi:hypothetical protein
MSTSHDTLEDELDLSPELADELARMVAEPSDELRRFARKCSQLLKSSGSACQHDLVTLLARRLQIRERKAEELQRKLEGMSTTQAQREATEVRSWSRERAAFVRLLPELRRAHPGKYVAIDGDEVVGVGDTRREAAEQGWERLGQTKSLAIRNVDEGPPQTRVIHLRGDRPMRVLR